MFGYYDYDYDPIFYWDPEPVEPVFVADPVNPVEPDFPAEPPSQFDGTQTGGNDDFLDDYLRELAGEALPAVTEQQLDQIEEAFESLETWLEEQYGSNYLDDFLDGTISIAQYENDLRDALLDGNADVWDAFWGMTGAVLGIEDIRSDPFWTNVIVGIVAQNLYGSSEGYMWDPATSRIVPDPNYMPPIPDDESGSEDDGDAYYDDEDSFVFDDDYDDDYYDDDEVEVEVDDGDDWSITVGGGEEVDDREREF